MSHHHPTTTQEVTVHICTTCIKPLAQPYRRTTADGTVTEGCVSAAHDDHADAWHMRPEAVAIRAQPKAWADVMAA